MGPRPRPAWTRYYLLGLLRFQHQWQAILRIADNHDLGIRARRQFLGGLDAFPFEQLGTDARRHDLLEVGNALRFDALALGFLLFLLKDKAHAQRVLLGLLLGLDRSLQHRRQLHIAQQHVFDNHAAWRELRLQLILNLLL